jgi:hypothetical protein
VGKARFVRARCVCERVVRSDGNPESTRRVACGNGAPEGGRGGSGGAGFCGRAGARSSGCAERLNTPCSCVSSLEAVGGAGRSALNVSEGPDLPRCRECRDLTATSAPRCRLSAQLILVLLTTGPTFAHTQAAIMKRLKDDAEAPVPPDGLDYRVTFCAAQIPAGRANFGTTHLHQPCSINSCSHLLQSPPPLWA